jgi:hypothetical protein
MALRPLRDTQYCRRGNNNVQARSNHLVLTLVLTGGTLKAKVVQEPKTLGTPGVGIGLK